MFINETIKTSLRRVPRPLLIAITGFVDGDGFLAADAE